MRQLQLIIIYMRYRRGPNTLHSHKNDYAQACGSMRNACEYFSQHLNLLIPLRAMVNNTG